MSMTETTKRRHRLNELPTGARGVVQHIEDAGPAAHRLMAMGLCVGREVFVARQGNPLILRVLSARVGVAGRVARQFVVEAS